MEILDVTRVYLGPGGNGPQGEQRNIDNKKLKWLKKRRSSWVKWNKNNKKFLGKKPHRGMRPAKVYIHDHTEYHKPDKDYFTLIWGG